MKIILATDEKGGIGLGGGLPWRLRDDLKHFKKATAGGVLLMGTRTALSMPRLAGRREIVVSRYGLRLEDAIELWPDAWVIGGATLFEAAAPLAEEIWHTLVLGEVVADTFVDMDIFKGFEAVGTEQRFAADGVYNSHDFLIRKWIKATLGRT